MDAQNGDAAVKHQLPRVNEMSEILDGTVPYGLLVLRPKGFGLIQGIRTY